MAYILPDGGSVPQHTVLEDLVHARLKLFPTLLLLIILAAILAGCGSSPSATGNSTSGTAPPAHCSVFKKAGIVAHLGLAYIAFKRYLYTPWREGKFHSGAPGRKGAIVKGVIAGLFAVHEARKAIQDASACGAASTIESSFSSIESRLGILRSGTATDAQVSNQISAIQRTFQTATSAAGL